MQSASLLHVFFLLALAAEAMTAALAAGRRRMDWVGVALLGCVTALGGGSLRDVLLGHYPLSWVQHPYYLAIAAGAALATIAIARFVHHLRLAFLFLDAVGLVIFTIGGCNVAMEMGQPLAIVIVAGVITGCAGGVIRDVLCNDIPLLFRAELYASVSVVSGCIYVSGVMLGIHQDIVLLITFAAGLAFRLLAIRYNWEMPKFIYTRKLH